MPGAADLHGDAGRVPARHQRPCLLGVLPHGNGVAFAQASRGVSSGRARYRSGIGGEATDRDSYGNSRAVAVGGASAVERSGNLPGRRVGRCTQV